MSTIFRTWVRRIESGTFGHGQCLQWAKAVVPLSKGKPAGGMRTNLTTEEASELMRIIHAADGVRLEREHSETGERWMRKPEFAKVFPAWALESFDRFSFQGDAIDISANYGQCYVPIWRVHGTDGQTLDYYAASWQSGRGYGPTIIRPGWADKL